MATGIEEHTNEEQHSVARSLSAKSLNAKDINKEVFPVCGGKSLSHKVVLPWRQTLP
jgi:hypothetical protein